MFSFLDLVDYYFPFLLFLPTRRTFDRSAVGTMGEERRGFRVCSNLQIFDFISFYFKPPIRSYDSYFALRLRRITAPFLGA